MSWYLDNVLPGEHGSPRPFYFFLTREYWGINSKNQVSGIEKALNEFPKDKWSHDQDVAEEEKRAVEQDKWAVRVVNLEKSFSQFESCKFKPVKAVNGISFTVEYGELFSLLGHNGLSENFL